VIENYWKDRQKWLGCVTILICSCQQFEKIRLLFPLREIAYQK